MIEDEESTHPLGMPVEMARQHMLDDPENAEVAEALGLELEDYVERIMHYALNPQLEPQLEVIPDEEARAMGIEVITEADVQSWLQGVADGTVELEGPVKVADESESFTTEMDEKEELVAAAGGETKKLSLDPPPTDLQPADPEVGRVLKDQLSQQLLRGNLGAPRKAYRKP